MKRFRSVMYGILVVNALALSGCGGWYDAERCNFTFGVAIQT
jgi:hypothetical protein